MAVRTFVAATLASLALAGTGLATSASAAPAVRADAHGCKSGYVCIYPGPSWNNDKPSYRYFDYGYYNLRGFYGLYRIFNNQTGGATMSTCLGSDGTRCEGKLQMGDWIDKDMTPINSIRLQA
ncbi:hypothetical protein [Streptomyces acidiscabies]|uniref:Peptidase inhibitor family I36 n=1 Tax=Streptomyces acidiscabies TaxID=42234 RepID=A0A0L0JHZ2_9ACTN|nr:hypothetical protein [Streptomyces acidiscabies]KND25223.1 hypothetical protein IQ63_41070 [Streptomyces acidiscabies]